MLILRTEQNPVILIFSSNSPNQNSAKIVKVWLGESQPLYHTISVLFGTCRNSGDAKTRLVNYSNGENKSGCQMV